jgi:hypothetical protein
VNLAFDPAETFPKKESAANGVVESAVGPAAGWAAEPPAVKMPFFPKTDGVKKLAETESARLWPEVPCEEPGVEPGPPGGDIASGPGPVGDKSGTWPVVAQKGILRRCVVCGQWTPPPKVTKMSKKIADGWGGGGGGDGNFFSGKEQSGNAITVAEALPGVADLPADQLHAAEFQDSLPAVAFEIQHKNFLRRGVGHVFSLAMASQNATQEYGKPAKVCPRTKGYVREYDN